MEVGQKATFTVDAFPGRGFEGVVKQIRKAAQNVSNVVTYTVVISAANPDKQLLPGMTANVRIVTERRADVLKVANAALRFRPPGVASNAAGGQRRKPAAAAAEGGGRPGRIYVLEQGQPKPLEVRLGLTDGTATEVISPQVREGMAVITSAGQSDASKPQMPPGPRMF